jgi:hypothetical protein
MTDAELTRAAAEKVMGWEHQEGDMNPEWYDRAASTGTGQRIWHLDWNPLASDADAFMLVDNLAGRDREISLEYGYMSEFRSYAWYVNFDDAGVARDPDRRRAIVLAALKAVSGKQEGE